MSDPHRQQVATRFNMENEYSRDKTERSELVVALNRFFFDIERKPDSYTDLIIAAEKLISSMPFVDSSVVQQYIDTNDWLLPLKLDVFDSMSEKERMERYALLPFASVGPSLETYQLQQETPDLVGVREWYSAAIKQFKRVTSPDHNETCLDSIRSTDEIVPCESRDMICPLHFVALSLRRDITMPDFSDIAYQINPDMKKALAETKVNLYVEYKFEDPDSVADYKRKYYDNFYEAVGTKNSLL